MKPADNQNPGKFVLQFNIKGTFMIYGYIRVSCDKQTTDNQQFEIIKFSKKNNIKIDRWIKETISSTQCLSKRKLWRLLRSLKKGDIMITSELSRLGRNLLQVMGILNYCMTKEAQVWTIKDNYRLGSDIQSKVLAFAFGLSAEIERNLISQRTREALLRMKSEGKILGRPKGSKNKFSKLEGKKEIISGLLEQKVSKAQIAQDLKISRMTLHNFLKNEES